MKNPTYIKAFRFVLSDIHEIVSVVKWEGQPTIAPITGRFQVWVAMGFEKGKKIYRWEKKAELAVLEGEEYKKFIKVKK